MTDRNADRPDTEDGSPGDAPLLSPAHGRDLVRDARSGLIRPADAPTGLLPKLTMVLARRSKDHPVLLGAPADCTAIIHELACALVRDNVPESLGGLRLYSFDVAAVAAGARDRADMEEQLASALVRAQRADRVVLYVENLLDPTGLRGSPAALDAADALRPAIRRGRIKIIGRAEPDLYRERIEARDAALARSFQAIRVPGRELDTADPPDAGPSNRSQ